MSDFPFEVISEATATVSRGGAATQQAHLETKAEAEVIHSDPELESTT